MASNMLLAGKVAIVTGAGSGIGRATCQLFARHGASVVAVDRSQQGIQETLASFSETTEQDHKSYAMDVTNRDAIRSMVAEVTEAFKVPPTVLVNSAGITRDQMMLRMTEEMFDDVINVNLKGTFLMSQAVCQAMVKGKVSEGSIVNISSISGKTGNMGQANYSASKSGVEGLTRTMAKEFGRFNIRCNAILPGFIKTPMTDAVPEKVLKMVEQNIPLGKMGDPEHIAATCLFLASPGGGYVTGASIEVTGGLGL